METAADLLEPPPAPARGSRAAPAPALFPAAEKVSTVTSAAKSVVPRARDAGAGAAAAKAAEIIV